MAVFKCDIPHEHNEMIKLAAKKSFMSKQKFIEKMIIEAAEEQATLTMSGVLIILKIKRYKILLCAI